ncbi:DMT family transporter [Xylanibacillus composti]|uniref:Transporter n=1 Tax=Xylanibacillus composti TaxID=1572762 RepID=A0A8J4H1A7_9BACL|nr:DMT family transporter [Xylanibacillus composti]MDT9725655.1 DMT family transporter [Xylanibacillus composti]GIQ67750.1 transporter [Xylanibacillus composti]
MKVQDFFRHPAGMIATAIVATLLWGIAFPIIKLSYEALSIAPDEIFEQMVFAGYRFILAGLMIYLVMIVSGQSLKLKPGTLRTVILIGFVLTFLQYMAFYIGMSRSFGFMGAIIGGMISFFQLMLAHVWYRDDRLNWRSACGLMLGFCGLFILFADQQNGITFGLGEALLLASAFFCAVGNLLSRTAARQLTIFAINSHQMVMGGIGLTAIGSMQAGLFPFTFQWVTMWYLLLLAFVSAASFMLWNTLMKYNQVGRVSMFLFLIPLFGSGWSALLLHEVLHASALAAIILVSCGIILVNRKSRADSESKRSGEQVSG